MTDLLTIATSGVKAYRLALEAVADNVANASTPGHVRRTTTLAPASISTGNGPLELDPVGGNGVRITGIIRAADLLRADSVRRSEAEVAGLDASARWLTTLESSLTGPASIDKPMREMFGALSDLANDPASPAVRTTLLARAETLSNRFNAGSANLDRIRADIAREADTESRSLNSLTQGLAKLNAQLRRTTAGSGASVVLADERDRLLGEMSALISFEVRLDQRGMANVRVPDSGGPLLVEGDRAQSVRVEPAGGGGYELRIGPQGADTPATLIGGSLNGLSAASRLVDQAQARLDSLADRIAADMNRIHAEGVDQNGADGKPLFATTLFEVIPLRANGGTARLRAEIADGSSPGAMVLTFDGSAYTLAREDLTASSSGTLPLMLDGLTIDGDGVATNGDQFALRPRNGAAGIALRPVGVDEIAAAPRWLADATPANTGSGRAEVRIAAPSFPPATGPFTVSTLANGSLELRDSLGSLLASGLPGDWLAGDAFAVRIAGVPATPDSFIIIRNSEGGGGNANALALLSLQDSGGTSGTYADAHDRMVTGVAVSLAETRSREDAARGNRDAAAEAFYESSGVDLNNEAAEMLRLQQAFQANARIIQTARETFDAILAAAQ